jgi:hypothetical protein
MVRASLFVRRSFFGRLLFKCYNSTLEKTLYFFLTRIVISRPPFFQGAEPHSPPFLKLSVSHIPYWTPENVVNHLNVEPFSHAHCVGHPLSVIARSPLLVRFAHTLRTGDEAISLLMRKRRDCQALRLAPTGRSLRTRNDSIGHCEYIPLCREPLYSFAPVSSKSCGAWSVS